MTDPNSDDAKKEAAWKEHNLVQLRYFRSLSLRNKMTAIEELCKIEQRFQQMRSSGRFHYPNQGTEESVVKENVDES